MWKKICNILFASVILILSVLTGIQSYRVHTLNRSVEQYRLADELSRRANEQYAEDFRRATEANTELGECLSVHTTTLAQLREQLQEVRARYERMQELFEEMADRYSGGDRDSVGGTSL